MGLLQANDKGILGICDPPKLWQDIIKQIPLKILENKSSKFLFPAIGNATEVKVLANKLKDLGWTKAEIFDSFYLCDKYYTFTNPAKAQGFKHVHTGDFLNWDIDMKFDVVIGNPPYQDGSLPQNNALWPVFVNKAYELLDDESGCIAFITPSSWMNPSGEHIKRKAIYNTGLIRKEIFGKNKMLFCTVESRLQKLFNVGSSFSAWVLQKGTADGCNIKTDDGEIFVDFSTTKFLPAILNKKSHSTVSKFFALEHELLGVTNMKGEGFHSSNSTRVVKTKTDGFDYPIADTSAKYTKGNFLWASEPHPYQTVNKVIVSESGYLGPMYDPGTLGTTEHSFIVPAKNKKDGERIVAMLNSKLYKFILVVCRWGSANHKYIIEHLPDCGKQTDSEIYKYFNLTQQEIDYIETFK